jgi:hypothetical protein
VDPGCVDPGCPLRPETGSLQGLFPGRRAVCDGGDYIFP